MEKPAGAFLVFVSMKFLLTPPIMAATLAFADPVVHQFIRPLTDSTALVCYRIDSVSFAPMAGMTLGDDYFHVKRTLFGELPKSVISPSGWSSQPFEEEEGDAIGVIWTPPDADPPDWRNKSISGLGVVVRSADTVHYHGTYYDLYDMKGVHFSKAVLPATSPKGFTCKVP